MNNSGSISWSGFYLRETYESPPCSCANVFLSACWSALTFLKVSSPPLWSVLSPSLCPSLSSVLLLSPPSSQQPLLHRSTVGNSKYFRAVLSLHGLLKCQALMLSCGIWNEPCRAMSLEVLIEVASSPVHFYLRVRQKNPRGHRIGGPK